MSEKWVRVRTSKEFPDADRNLIRTHKIKEGMANLWSYDDIAHVWLDGVMYRITKKGTILREASE